MPPSRKRVLIALLVLAALAAAGATLVLDRRPGGAAGALVLYGNIDVREVDLAFNTEGRIDRVLAEEGDAVRRGQLLAELDSSRYRARADAARALVAARKAVLDRLLAGSRPEEIRKEREDVRAIQAELDDARSTLKRIEELAREQFAAQQKLDNARAAVRSLAAKLKGAKQMLALAVKGPRREDIVEARANLGVEKARLALIEEELKDTRLYAREAGVVRTRILEPGAVVRPDTPVYTISIVDPLWVRTYVSEPDLGRVRPGAKAKIFTDSAPDRSYDGWIGFVSPVAEFTPKTVETPRLRSSLVYRLRVYVRNPGNTLRQGMPVTVRLVTDEAAAGGRETPQGRD